MHQETRRNFLGFLQEK